LDVNGKLQKHCGDRTEKSGNVRDTVAAARYQYRPPIKLIYVPIYNGTGFHRRTSVIIAAPCICDYDLASVHHYVGSAGRLRNAHIQQYGFVFFLSLSSLYHQPG